MTTLITWIRRKLRNKNAKKNKHKDKNKFFKEALLDVFVLTNVLEKKYVNFIYSSVTARKNSFYDRLYLESMLKNFININFDWSWYHDPEVILFNNIDIPKKTIESLKVEQLKTILCYFNVKYLSSERKQDLKIKVLNLHNFDDLVKQFNFVNDLFLKLSNENHNLKIASLSNYIGCLSLNKYDLAQAKEFDIITGHWQSSFCPIDSHKALDGKDFNLHNGLFDPSCNKNIFPSELHGCQCNIEWDLPS